jgi:uncharacterized OB-fold protein
MGGVVTEPPFRVLPRLDEETEFFWTSGRDGKLRFLRCTGCAYLVHPPAPVCPTCLGSSLAPDAVSGRATVHSYTVNHHPWDGSTEPWAIVLVEIEEQADVRLTTNMVGIAPDDITIGMPVRVVFEDHDPIFVPLFEPAP